MIIHLSAEGTERIEQILPQHVQAICEAMDALTVDEQETLSVLCKKLGLAASKK